MFLFVSFVSNHDFAFETLYKASYYKQVGAASKTEIVFDGVFRERLYFFQVRAFDLFE